MQLHHVHIKLDMFADEKSELGMEELMAEAYTLKAIHDKVRARTDLASVISPSQLDHKMPTLVRVHFAHTTFFFLQAGSHPNLISLLGTTTNGGPVCLLLEYVPHGCLDEFLLSLRQGPTPDWYMQFLRETLRGAYHKHVSGDLMSIIVQVAKGMVRLIPSTRMIELILLTPSNCTANINIHTHYLIFAEIFDGTWLYPSRSLYKKHPHW